MAVVLNDTAFYGMGGAAGVLKGESPVKMVSADIRIQIPSCVVEVNYVFKNITQEAVDVPMGFPEEAVEPGGLTGKTWFKKFETWVDGVPIKPKMVKLEEFSDSIEGGYTRNWWTKEVKFGAGQSRRVRNRYVTQPGYQTPGAYFVYLVNTAENWNGKVDRLRIEVDASGFAKGTVFTVPWRVHKRVGDRVMWFWEDVEPAGRFDLTMRWPSDPGDREYMASWKDYIEGLGDSGEFAVQVVG